jgi:hypothetical protein
MVSSERAWTPEQYEQAGYEDGRNPEETWISFGSELDPNRIHYYRGFKRGLAERMAAEGLELGEEPLDD